MFLTTLFFDGFPLFQHTRILRNSVFSLCINTCMYSFLAPERLDTFCWINFIHIRYLRMYPLWVDARRI
jgi:hypothetical protein